MSFITEEYSQSQFKTYFIILFTLINGVIQFHKRIGRFNIQPKVVT